HLDGQRNGHQPAMAELLLGATLVSDARLVQEDGRWDIKGDPTEGALVVAAAKAGLHKEELDRQSPRLAEIPFTSETKRMTTLHAFPDGQRRAYSKGAPEVILQSSTQLLTENGVQPISAADRETILQIAQNMGDEALRVLAVASRPVDSLKDAEQDMTFLG